MAKKDRQRIRKNIWKHLQSDICDDIEFMAEKEAQRRFGNELTSVDEATQEHLIIQAVYDYLRLLYGAERWILSRFSG